MLREALGLPVGGHSGNVGGVGPRQVRQGLVARFGVRTAASSKPSKMRLSTVTPRANNAPLSLAAATCPGPSLSPCSWTAAHVAAYSSTGPEARGVVQVTIIVCSRRAASAKPSARPSTTISPSEFGAGLPDDGATAAGRSEGALGHLRAVVHARAALRVQRYQLDGVHVGDARPCGDPRGRRREQRH